MNFMDLSVGDEVIVSAGGFGCSDHICKIERKTKKYVVVNGQYYNESGWMRGGDRWHRSSLVELTEERRNKILLSNAKAYLQHVLANFEVPDDLAVVRDLIKLLSPYKKEGKK